MLSHDALTTFGSIVQNGKFSAAATVDPAAHCTGCVHLETHTKLCIEMQDYAETDAGPVWMSHPLNHMKAPLHTSSKNILFSFVSLLWILPTKALKREDFPTFGYPTLIKRMKRKTHALAVLGPQFLCLEKIQVDKKYRVA